MSNNCVLNTVTHKYLQATGNEEIVKPPVQSCGADGRGTHGRATNYGVSTGTRKYFKTTGNGEIEQVALEIIVEQLCTKFRYT